MNNNTKHYRSLLASARKEITVQIPQPVPGRQGNHITFKPWTIPFGVQPRRSTRPKVGSRQ